MSILMNSIQSAVRREAPEQEATIWTGLRIELVNLDWQWMRCYLVRMDLVWGRRFAETVLIFHISILRRAKRKISRYGRNRQELV